MRRGDPGCEALCGERMSRSESEPVLAALRLLEMAIPSEGVKPDRNREVMSASTCSVSRGWNGQRVRTGRLRNLGDPAGCWLQQHLEGMHNLRTGPGWKSDRPIVAKKRVTTVERRGLTVNTSL